MKSWWKRFSTFRQLSWPDRWLLGQTFLVVLVVRLGLKLLSFSQFKTLYSQWIKADRQGNTPDELVQRRVWAIQKVSGMLRAVCLPQALALAYFLRHDRHVELVIGVRKSRTFEAHAWVEKNGQILLGDLPDLNFQPIWTWQ